MTFIALTKTPGFYRVDYQTIRIGYPKSGVVFASRKNKKVDSALNFGRIIRSSGREEKKKTKEREMKTAEAVRQEIENFFEINYFWTSKIMTELWNFAYVGDRRIQCHCALIECDITVVLTSSSLHKAPRDVKVV